MSEHEFDFEALEREFAPDPELQAAFETGRAPWADELVTMLTDEHEEECARTDPEHLRLKQEQFEGYADAAERAVNLFGISIRREGPAQDPDEPATLETEGRFYLEFNEAFARELANVVVIGINATAQQANMAHMLGGGPNPHEQEWNEERQQELSYIEQLDELYGVMTLLKLSSVQGRSEPIGPTG